MSQGTIWHQFYLYKILKKLNANSVSHIQVGLELVSRDYDMESVNPFRSSDIISMVPVCKVDLFLSLSHTQV